jgi:hypothetical protein
MNKLFPVLIGGFAAIATILIVMGTINIVANVYGTSEGSGQGILWGSK